MGRVTTVVRVALVAAVLGGSYAFWESLAPGPITGRLRYATLPKRGNLILLTPEPLKQGMPQAAVESLLAAEGYKPGISKCDVCSRIGLAAGETAYWREESGIPCSTAIVMAARYDGDHKLTEARGAIYDKMCL